MRHCCLLRTVRRNALCASAGGRLTKALPMSTPRLADAALRCMCREKISKMTLAPNAREALRRAPALLGAGFRFWGYSGRLVRAKQALFGSDKEVVCYGMAYMEYDFEDSRGQAALRGGVRTVR